MSEEKDKNKNPKDEDRDDEDEDSDEDEDLDIDDEDLEDLDDEDGDDDSDEDEDDADEDDEGEDEDDDDASDEGDDDASDEGDDDASDEGDEDDKKKRSDSTVNIQRKKWRKRALIAERKLREKAVKKGKKIDSATNKSERAAMQERNDFRFDHPNLTTREINEIEAVARAKGISLEEAKRSPIIKLYLKAQKRKREQDGTSVDTRHRAAPRKKEKDYMKMSPEEFEAEKLRVKSMERNKAK